MVFIRLAKIAAIAALAAYALIVACDNIVDYGSNYEFVRHVLSMDTTFPGNALMHRAITDEGVCGDYTVANTQVVELLTLADERGSPFWKAYGTAVRGMLFTETGKASDAVRAITSGITSVRSTGASLYEPFYLWYLAMAWPA